MSTIRKDQHIEYAIKSASIDRAFNDIHILYNSLPELNFHDIETNSKFLGKNFGYPLLINAMTGGSLEGKEINKALALASAKFNIPMAVGSQTIAIKDSSLRDSFEIARKVNKDGYILANVSANVPLEWAKKAVEMLEADGLQLHLNVLQELIMEEGDRDFRGILENINNIKSNIRVPVVVKEVGFGMSVDAIKKLKQIGIKTVDIGGFGGTNFAKIEYMRRNNTIGDELYSIGIPTPVCIYKAAKEKLGIEIICGGGIRSGLDITKAMILGADAVSIAYPILKAYKDSGELGVVRELEKLIYEFKVSMIAAGCGDASSLHHQNVVIMGKTLQWINQI